MESPILIHLVYILGTVQPTSHHGFVSPVPGSIPPSSRSFVDSHGLTEKCLGAVVGISREIRTQFGGLPFPHHLVSICEII